MSELSDVDIASAEIDASPFEALRPILIRNLSGKPRKLHPSLCYSEEGSGFFESLLHQPEYYPSKVERGLLFRESHSICEIVCPDTVIDLGCGNMEKTQIIIHEAVKRGARNLYACDIDSNILELGSERLKKFYWDRLHIVTDLMSMERYIGTFSNYNEKKLFLFLGTTFGNFSKQERVGLISSLHNAMYASDYFLMGVDLIKSSEILEAAYNDSARCLRDNIMVMLKTLNRVYGGEFDMEKFDHVARYEPDRRAVVSYIVSTVSQVVPIHKLGISLELEAGEKIEAEMCEKFVLTELIESIQSFGLRPVKIEVDDEIPYALLLFSGPKENVPTEGGAEGEAEGD